MSTQQFEPRREQLWVTYKVKRALSLLAKGRRSEDGTSAMSYDEIGDKMLWEMIKQQFPEILEHQKRVGEMEKQLIKTLGGTT